MKLWVVIINDRHVDPEPYVFTTPHAAVAFCRDYLADCDEVEESTIVGWLFHARYGVEGDAVWVSEKETDPLKS